MGRTVGSPKDRVAASGQASKEQALQSSNHREVNSANNLQELRGGFFPDQAR